ncbi:PD-(D/E)XK nuclease family protein [Nocardiopsis sp. NPDC050513]|uniref:PD-(D/E)XK nuclease family protein n=1 Tax=Nocardiopsis sp. NPDC050513 TaxID=3364338 RepID=UPI0037AE8D9E
MAPWTTGTADLAPVIRVHSDAVRPDARRCPTRLRTGSEQDFGRAVPGRRPYFAHSPPGPLTAVLDLVEHQGWTVDEACAHLPARGDRGTRVMGGWVAPAHEGLLAWTRHAATTYLDVLAADGADRIPVADPWIRQHLPGAGRARARPYEICVRGRRYLLFQGSEVVRELRVPVPSSARPATDADAEAAVAAFVAATGTHVDQAAVEAAPWRYAGGTPYPTRTPPDAPPPTRVRVVRVSCLDGDATTVFDGTVAEARELFAAVGREGLRTALIPGRRVPGGDCLPCRVRDGCDRLPRAPGLLGVRDRSRPRRSWSVTTGRYHRQCPAKAHFHDLGLPAVPVAEQPGARPAEAVRSLVARLHSRTPARACTRDDLPVDRGAWSADGVGPTGRAARTGASMFEHHLTVCPLGDAARAGPIRVGLSLTVDDPRSDVLVRTGCDLVFRRGGSWVLRDIAAEEVDTGPDGPGLLARHPRTALLVLLVASGGLPGDTPAVVELERLTPSGVRVLSIDPALERHRSAARTAVRELASAWHADTAHPATPGRVCRTCPYRRWCPDARTQPLDGSSPPKGTDGSGQGEPTRRTGQ